MGSKGFLVFSCQATRKVEAGNKPSHTTETLIDKTACYSQSFFDQILVHHQL
ncbi:hypothetical protein L3X37_07730 [Sabulilitoribacter arenilitoris]|uniref:Uncharacterized protein n=1 Tax=Wocania arenilitoris TaxID=2044858 RepID=A0AAE3JN39_9FLAO|nr:hypothetical protein [Wocania arenilitoris]MCF7568251.1 hypothetical protein [Wocania arenilitoris]